MKQNWFRFLVAALAVLYFVWCTTDPAQWHFLDGVNLMVHEAGHVVFMPFGQFLYVLGGSLLQVLVPALFVIYFYRQGYSFSAALVLFWAGESLLNVSNYAADAVRMQLPLLGGDNSTHDWNWLLVYTGQLHHTGGIALIIRILGTLAIIAAAVWSFWAAGRAKAPAESVE